MKNRRAFVKIVFLYFLFVFFIDFLHIGSFVRKTFERIGLTGGLYSTGEVAVITSTDPIPKPPIPPPPDPPPPDEE
ncbi:MAG TPA: hypothetical protein ENN03_02965 [bacterium]|nr:hypothetical protein [bacterium]